MAIMPTMTALSSVFRSALSSLYEPATLVTVNNVPDGMGGTLPVADLQGWVLETGAWQDAGVWRTDLPYSFDGSSTVTGRPVRVQEDRIKEETRQAGGYSQQAKRFIILQDGGDLTGDSRLTVGGVTYDLSEPEQDPVKAYWYVIGVPRE